MNVALLLQLPLASLLLCGRLPFYFVTGDLFLTNFGGCLFKPVNRMQLNQKFWILERSKATP